MTNGDSLFLPISKRGRGLRSSWLGSSRGYFQNNSVDARDLGTSPLPTMSDDPAGVCAVACATVCVELIGGFCLDFASISKSSWVLVAQAFDPLYSPSVHQPSLFAAI